MTLLLDLYLLQCKEEEIQEDIQKSIHDPSLSSLFNRLSINGWRDQSKSGWREDTNKRR